MNAIQFHPVIPILVSAYESAKFEWDTNSFELGSRMNPELNRLSGCLLSPTEVATRGYNGVCIIKISAINA